ncbi:unnamed protein product [Paramecium sonneborni]|uniref:Uncharacterized protein n=1 Tax=Paramecium sonneborni TaxID=65129 RepID=A0A8S1LRS4_9CILI|nr:unnamed protein product [Paramecium sonneborni]
MFGLLWQFFMIFFESKYINIEFQRSGVCIIRCYENPFFAVQQSSVDLVEKFGKYHRSLPPGLNQINPCKNLVIPVDMRTRLLDLDRQIILIKDKIQVNITHICILQQLVFNLIKTFFLNRSCIQSFKIDTIYQRYDICCLKISLWLRIQSIEYKPFKNLQNKHLIIFVILSSSKYILNLNQLYNYG